MASKGHHRSFDVALKLRAVDFAVKKGEEEAAARERRPVIGKEPEESNEFAVLVIKKGWRNAQESKRT